MKMVNAFKCMAASAAMMMGAAAADASVMFDSGDCDNVVGISDECGVSSYSTYTVDILYTDAVDTTGGSAGFSAFTVLAFDPVEITSLSFAFNGILGTTRDLLLTNGLQALGVGYFLVDGLSDGDVIGTLTYTTGLVGVTPDDDVSDLKLAGSSLFGTTVYDPIYGLAARSNVDVQAVPVPVPALLLLGGIGVLASLRRRAA
ncbi:hypothetical protein [Mangrovicoccus sp. HB161399]|uniref:hypothetical protein n=1 Tax=Mangrovicoccus sp. HB161399 TaxID=2720392 RepID=UPI001553B861|nr:hypothetical protein [Mangrovicoccus sp. HB161399]